MYLGAFSGRMIIQSL
uniref:Uncharacterized protein n=1 Tax=Rhizophora mucronata TaxID=61149 RepID=A0A2P2PJ30_RHIMU